MSDEVLALEFLRADALGVALGHVVQQQIHDIRVGQEVRVIEEEEEPLNEGRVGGRVGGREGAGGVFDAFPEAATEGAKECEGLLEGRGGGREGGREGGRV